MLLIQTSDDGGSTTCIFSERTECQAQDQLDYLYSMYTLLSANGMDFSTCIIYLKVPVQKSLENEFLLNWQIYSPFSYQYIT